MTENELEKELEALASMVLSKPEKIAFGLLIFTKYKRDFTPFVNSSGVLIVQEEEFSLASKSDAKELEALCWEQETQCLWGFKL